MQFCFTFKHMDSSEEIQTYTQSKLNDKIRKFVGKPIAADVTFDTLRHHYTVHCHLTAGDGFSIEVESDAKDMHAAVDLLVDRLSHQLSKIKEKNKGYRNNVKKMTPRSRKDDSIDAEDLLKYEQARQRVNSRY